MGIACKTIYNRINHGLLKINISDFPDKCIRDKRQSDGRRLVFAHGRSIEKRPKAVKLRQEFGHFEVDTMQSGKVRGDVLMTITERLSRQHIVRHHRDFNSQAVTPAIIRFLKGIENAKSITVDHGLEFAKYDEIDEKLRIPVYFAHPYSPKERKIKKISQKELD